MRYIVNKKDGGFYNSYSKQIKTAYTDAIACALSIRGTVVDQDTGKQVWPVKKED